MVKIRIDYAPDLRREHIVYNMEECFFLISMILNRDLNDVREYYEKHGAFRSIWLTDAWFPEHLSIRDIFIDPDYQLFEKKKEESEVLS